MLLAAVLAACAPPIPPPVGVAQTPTPALIRLTVCQSSLGTNMSPLQYAVDNGVFEQFGLDVDVVVVDGGPIAVTAMIADEFDVCLIAGPAVASAVVAGEDVRMISGMVNTFVYSLFVDPSITKPSDLKGKAIAVSDPGSSSDTALRAALIQLGLEPDKEVAILSMGGQAERLAAFKAGSVQGTLVTPPQTAMARDEGLFELYDLGKLGVPYQHTGIAATKAFLDEQPQVAERFMKAMLTSIARMQNDETGAKATLANMLELDTTTDAHLLDEAFTVSIKGYLNKGPNPTLEGIQTALDELELENPKAAGVQAEDVVDLRVLDALRQQGFLATLGKE